MICSYSSGTQRSFAIEIYSSAISIPIDFLLFSIATRHDVPVPTKGSNTIPFGGQVSMMGVLHKSAGYGAKWDVLP